MIATVMAERKVRPATRSTVQTSPQFFDALGNPQEFAFLTFDSQTEDR
jgi:hypothetical protein